MSQNLRISHQSRAGVLRWAELGLVLCLLSLTGCYQRILRADFNEYSGTPGGSLLQGSIPGIPSGDFIEFSPGCSVVVDQFIEGKSLRVTDTVELVAAAHEDADQYRMDWVGYRDFSGAATNSTITLMDDEEDPMLILEFNAAARALRFVSGTPGQLPEVSLADKIHSIRIFVDMRAGGRIDFFLDQADENPSVLPDLDFLSNDFDELRRIRIEGASSAVHYMNDMDIFARRVR